MAAITVGTVIEAPPAAVWSELADLGAHATWMVDAVSITFVGPQRRGPGTRFDCATRVGPLRTTDRMVVVEWVEGTAIGVRHVGLVTGAGRFTLDPRPRRGRGMRTEVRWTEDLLFPWWLAGRLGAWAGRPVLRRLWRRNLANLKAHVEGPTPVPAGPEKRSESRPTSLLDSQITPSGGSVRTAERLQSCQATFSATIRSLTTPDPAQRTSSVLSTSRHGPGPGRPTR